MVNHTRYEHRYTVVIITWLIIRTPLYSGYNYMVNHTRYEHSLYSGYNYMVNHTRYKHHYTVVIITWLIILGMNTIIQWL